MSENKNVNMLETESPAKLMRRYSIPCVISLLVGALYNIVDQIFIANADYLGSYGNAANTVVFPLTMVALALATMIGDGCCAFVSISLGARKHDDAHRSVGNSVLLMLIVSVLLMAVYLVFQDGILRMFGGDVNRQTFEMSREYLLWISLGIPFYMFSQGVNPIIRSDGSPRYAMLTLLAGAVFNLVFDPILIFWAHWGMMGAAVATVGGQVLSSVLALRYLMHMQTVDLQRDSFRPYPHLLTKTLPLGFSSFLTQISVVLSMAVVNNMAKHYGALDAIFGQEQYAQIPTAVIGIVMKFFQIVISIAIGVAAGCIPLVGYNLGAGRHDRVRQLMWQMLKVEALIGLVATAIFELFPAQFAAIFGSAHESVYYTDFCIKCIRLFLCMLVLACVNKGVLIFFQSLGKARVSTGLSLLREVVMGVGLPMLLPLVWGLDGLLYFMAVADVVTFVIAACYIYRADRELAGAGSQLVPQAATAPVNKHQGGA